MALQYSILSGLLSLIPLAALPAQQEQKAQVQDGQAQDVRAQEKESIDDIIASFQAKKSEWHALNREAKTPEAKKKLRPLYPRPNSACERIMKLAIAKPKSETSATGFIWVVQNQATPLQMKQALPLLTEHHIGHKNLARVCQSLAYQISEEAENFLRAANTNHPDNKVKGYALYNLAKSLQRRASTASRVKNDEKLRARLTKYYGQEIMELLRRSNTAALDDEAEKYLQQVVESFTQLPYRNKKTLADVAKLDLFEIRNLAIGKMAPDISGEDIDAVEFKLSDYRGKIVLLDFWGDW